jgi:hypothetical protein
MDSLGALGRMRHEFETRSLAVTRRASTFYLGDRVSSIHEFTLTNPTTESGLVRLAASRSLIMLTAVYLLGISSTFAQGTPQAVAGESPSRSQEPSLVEKIRDISPDKRFAMRISYDAELNNQVIKVERADAEKIFSQTIKAIELVSLPDKSVVANFLADQQLGGEYDFILLVWSPDSKWCAFYATAPRIGYTTVYKQSGNKFDLLNQPQELSVKIEGHVNHEYIRPVEWTKPGVLVLEQSATFSQGGGDERPIRFTAKFDEKTDEFRIISKKRATSGLPHGYD